MREKAEKDQQFKTDELDERKRELEIRKVELESNQNQENQMFQYLHAQNNQMLLLLANIANSGGSKNHKSLS